MVPLVECDTSASSRSLSHLNDHYRIVEFETVRDFYATKSCQLDSYETCLVLVEGYAEVVVFDGGRGAVPLALDEDLQGRRGDLALGVGHLGAVEHPLVSKSVGDKPLF